MKILRTRRARRRRRTGVRSTRPKIEPPVNGKGKHVSHEQNDHPENPHFLREAAVPESVHDVDGHEREGQKHREAMQWKNDFEYVRESLFVSAGRREGESDRREE